MSTRLIIRNVEVQGRKGQHVLIEDGRIVDAGPQLRGGADEIDGRGGALIPGLADHHIHLFALAAQADSIALEGARNAAGLAARIGAAIARRPAGAWVRATGYHERMAGELDRQALDRLAPNHRLRVQHQTGSLWILNSLALQALNLGSAPAGLERDAAGAPTGRLWREDAWLRDQLGAAMPPLAPIGRALAGFGVTAVTDASVSTDSAGAAHLGDAVRAGDLPLRLTLMSGGPLQAPADGAFAVGPVKILLDDHALPPLEQMVETIGRARAWRRPVAVHCVTAGELAVTLAAFDAAGARPGDRIEHGGVISASAIGEIRRLGLTVVTQPAFVEERGDRYLADVEKDELGDLYRCASLMAAGVPVAGSSDAPYATADPWVGIAAAVARRTRDGRPLGRGERLSPAQALCLYLADPARPAGPLRQVAIGAPADLCLLDAPLHEVLATPSVEHVCATIMAGRVVWPGPVPAKGLGAPAPAAMTSG
ncbi:MAG TPA: amidohydrolase family protein [Caulobacteraceae bacterium]|nr:amidohydrolase family protein [Caulobacteraceae bacterium]